ncbi:TPA: hypothetical protein ACQ8QG_004564, partial [Escherichia coli]
SEYVFISILEFICPPSNLMPQLLAANLLCLISSSAAEYPDGEYMHEFKKENEHSSIVIRGLLIRKPTQLLPLFPYFDVMFNP